jgi:ribosome-associated translation inhibitor RaiA/cold shock CspA family protein
MPFPLQINARNFRLPEALESEIREKAVKLESYFPRIVRGRIAIEAPLRHHRTGGPYQVRLTLTVPGSELVVTHHSDKDPYLASRDAFDAMGRQLEEYARQRRGVVKNHEEPLLEGRVIKLFHTEGYGFLETTDEREIYFHRNSVLAPGFDHVAIGAVVRFAEEQGAEGPQASTVHLV